MNKTPTPVTNAMLICDSVIVESKTEKKSLIGIFENIRAAKFPCTHGSLTIYIKLTNAHGGYKFVLNLVDLDDNTVIGGGKLPQEINVPSPLNTHDLIFNLLGLKFKHPGKYEFQLFANDKIIGQKTFLVDEIEAPSQGK